MNRRVIAGRAGLVLLFVGPTGLARRTVSAASSLKIPPARQPLAGARAASVP